MRVLKSALEKDLEELGSKQIRVRADDPHRVLRFYAFLCDEEARLLAEEHDKE